MFTKASSFIVYDRAEQTDKRVVKTSKENVYYQIDKLLVQGRDDDCFYGSKVLNQLEQPFKGRNSVVKATAIAADPIQNFDPSTAKRKVIIKKYGKGYENSVINETRINNMISALGEHKNIAEFIETAYDCEDNSYYCIVKYYNGPDLFDFMAKRQEGLSESNAAKIMKKIVNGVAFLHLHGVAHGDLSAMNIVFDGPDNIRLIDFEMAKYVPHTHDDDENDFYHAEIPLNGSSGTKKYLAPEIYEQRKKFYNPFASDIWSLGVILFFMLVGCEIYETPSVEDSRFKFLINGKLKKMLKQWHVHLSEEALDLLQGMLQYHPAERYTVEDIWNHPWLIKNDASNESQPHDNYGEKTNSYNPDVVAMNAIKPYPTSIY